MKTELQQVKEENSSLKEKVKVFIAEQNDKKNPKSTSFLENQVKTLKDGETKYKKEL